MLNPKIAAFREGQLDSKPLTRKGFTDKSLCHYDTLFKKTQSKKAAFTLAEVLITLGIIGVVAAMTMPTLLNSTQGAQYKTAYKKALSVLNQAVVMNVALDDYDLTQATETDTTKATDGTSASLYNLFNKRMNVAKVCIGACSDGLSWGVDGFTNQSNASNHPFGKAANYTFFFNDGIVLTFPQANYVGGQSCTLNQNKNYWCRGVIDVNGKKNPNKLITCDAGTEGDNCQVSNPTDVYPILLHDQTIEPATQAAKVVMYGGK